MMQLYTRVSRLGTNWVDTNFFPQDRRGNAITFGCGARGYRGSEPAKPNSIRSAYGALWCGSTEFDPMKSEGVRRSLSPTGAIDIARLFMTLATKPPA
jgi:hypothetical protein